MLTDAFITAVEGNILRCVNVDNIGNYGYFLADSLLGKTSWYIIVDNPMTVRNMDPLLGVENYDMYDSWIEWTDSDGDGITDFDEVYRFGSNPKLADSDFDGVNDKDEIHSYALLEKSQLNLADSYVRAYTDLTQMRFIRGIKREYMADVDGDGLRAELDPGSDNLATARPDGKETIDRHFRAENWPWKLNIELPSFDEGDSVLVVQSGDSCFLSDNDRFRMLKVESGGVVYFPVGSVYIGDLQLDAGSLVSFENQSRNTVLYVKGKILWKSTFSYKTGRNFSYDFVARHFKLVYSGIERVFFDTNWYGTIVAPNAKIILGQTNAKELYGQFYANEIVIHQYAHLTIVHFDPNKDKLEYAFNERK